MAAEKYRGKSYHLWHPFTQMEDLMKIIDIGPAMVVRGKGPYVYNRRGDRFINFLSGLWNVAAGWGREELAEAAARQMKTLAFASLFRQSHPRAVELAARLVKITGGFYQRVFLGSNGSEAVETAIKMARQCMKQSPRPADRRRHKIISLKHSYHGVSYGALSTSGLDSDEKRFGPLLPGFVQIPPPYCYRCPYKKVYPQCGLVCARRLEEVIRQEGDVAAFIVEPVMGSYGTIPLPPEYPGIVGRICQENGVLLIADEVTTGFGRIGKLFASEEWDPRPDILCLGKAITSGYFPVSATLATDRIYRHFTGPGRQFEHGSTHAGHPVGAAVALKNIDILLEENLPQNARVMGKYLLPRLRKVLENRPIAGDIRGKGLMIGIELVVDRATREPLPDKKVFNYVVDLAVNGLLVYYRGNTLGLMPPLIIDQDIADQVIRILDRSLRRGVKSYFSKKGRLAWEAIRARMDLKRKKKT